MRALRRRRHRRSNAGAAWEGRIGDVSDELLRKSFELNFFAHQTVAKEAVRIMLKQNTGGCLLFNISKQAVNPGANFGPYGLPKAATSLLMRQYALDYGKDRIRSNGVNADRIRSGLLTDAMIKARSAARGMSEEEYMSGNLLGVEVLAEDVAQSFMFLASRSKPPAISRRWTAATSPRRCVKLRCHARESGHPVTTALHHYRGTDYWVARSSRAMTRR